MTVYVDDMYRHPMGRFRSMKMSHMIADSEDELHAMADRLGLKRAWFQGDHYDVSLGVRKRAIALGAIPVTLRQLGFMVMHRRRHGSLPRLEELDVLMQAYVQQAVERARAEGKPALQVVDKEI
jgi:hypothetical protein